MHNDEEFNECVCLLAEYIIENPSREFSFQLGIFHGQPMIVKYSDAITDLKRYLAVDCEKEFSDEQFVGYFGTFCEAIFDRQDDYKRNITVSRDGSMAISSYNQYIPVRGFQKFPEFSV